MLVFIPTQSVCHQIAGVTAKSSHGSLLGLRILVQQDHFSRVRGEKNHLLA